jgi:hypothetical protein
VDFLCWGNSLGCLKTTVSVPVFCWALLPWASHANSLNILLFQYFLSFPFASFLYSSIFPVSGFKTAFASWLAKSSSSGIHNQLVVWRLPVWWICEVVGAVLL